MNTDADKKPASTERPPWFFRIVRNWLSLAGAVLAIAAVFAFVLLFLVDLFAKHANPYMGILAYVVAPAFFFMGLALVLGGHWIQRRQTRKTGVEGGPLKFNIDLSQKRHRTLLMLFALGSVGFLFLTAFGSYQTYHLTETNSFCGETCHEPMEPQAVAHQMSEHAQVACVACHVGPGATAYVKTKVNGVRQLYHTVLGDFDRPIRLHQRDRRPSEETCQSCHWQQKHTGSVLREYTHYLADEENTPWTVKMMVHVGGGDALQGPVKGIHWHMNLSNRIEFVQRGETGESIPWVRLTDGDGKVTVFRNDEMEGDPAPEEIVTMDCMDCHNRPAHRFSTPNDAVDLAMANNRIDPTMPWAKKNAVDALTKEYANRDEALAGIEKFLKAEYPEDPRGATLVSEVQEIYLKNFFPEMKTDWRNYPEHIGHKNWVGCFRCHDGSHVAEDGETTIKASDCTTCHTIISQGSTPEELAKMDSNGAAFLHIDFEYEDFDCADCHTGANQEEE